MTQDFKNLFDAEYSFIGFVLATGLKAPQVSEYYNHFRTFAWNYVHNAQGPLSEAFELWTRETDVLIP